MALIRAMVVLQGKSLLPEDRFVNVFHFDSDLTSYESAADDVAAALHGFYNIPGTPSTTRISEYLSSFIRPAYEIRTYNLADAEPREPTIHPFTLGAPALVSTNLPEECAVCVTLEGAPPVTRRRRGRFYLGPFNQQANQPASTNLASRPAAGMITTIRDSAAALLASPQGAWWRIRSERPAQNFVPIVGGYVDNAWDTQRRRGVDPSSRQPFPSPA